MPFLTLKELGLKPLQPASQVNSELKRNLGNTSVERRIFLFFKTQDQERVSSMVNLLKSLRINLFIDYLEFPVLEGTTRNALDVIRERLLLCDKAILMATPQTWQATGFPTDTGWNGSNEASSKLAVFPITEQPLYWAEKEEYRVYGYIRKKFSLFNFPKDWQVVFPEGGKISLKDWLLS